MPVAPPTWRDPARDALKLNMNWGHNPDLYTHGRIFVRAQRGDTLDRPRADEPPSPADA